MEATAVKPTGLQPWAQISVSKIKELCDLVFDITCDISEFIKSVIKWKTFESYWDTQTIMIT